MEKAMTLRLPPDQAREAEVVARVEGLSLSALVRSALAETIAARRADPEFRARMRRHLEEDREILERLAE
jgi:hypothetical protein